MGCCKSKKKLHNYNMPTKKGQLFELDIYYDAKKHNVNIQMEKDSTSTMQPLGKPADKYVRHLDELIANLEEKVKKDQNEF